MNPSPPDSSPAKCPRRDWLRNTGLWLTATGLSVSTGCPAKVAVPPAKPSARNDVPLRVAWVGSPNDADLLKRIWGSVSDQPINVNVIPSLRSSPTEDSVSFFDAAPQSDVLVYPLLQMSELVSRQHWMPMPLLNSADDRPLPAALKVAVTLGDEVRGRPLGGALPAILLGEKSSFKGINSWDEIDAAASAESGQWGQPTAPMWAAWTYLCRAAAMIPSSWLFDRQTLQPIISDREYVEVLTRMKSWGQSDRTGKSPSEIWEAIGSGELVGGIGFPAISGATDGSLIEVTSFPKRVTKASSDEEGSDSQSVARQVLDPLMLVASLSSSCRQTTAAARFIQWLAGGEGSAPLYGSIAELLDPTRTSAQSNNTAAPYWSWWKKTIQTTHVIPALQLLDGQSYYRTLDEKVRECLSSELSPQAACDQIADAWTKIHDRVGLDNQKRTWQRAMGLS